MGLLLGKEAVATFSSYVFVGINRALTCSDIMILYSLGR